MHSGYRLSHSFMVGSVFYHLSFMPRAGWFALEIAAAILSRNEDSISALSKSISTEFDDNAIRQIWRKAKLALETEDMEWMRECLLNRANEYA